MRVSVQDVMRMTYHVNYVRLYQVHGYWNLCSMMSCARILESVFNYIMRMAYLRTSVRRCRMHGIL